MISPRRLVASLLALVFALSVAGCGDTWHGLKKDTSENLKGTGEAIHEGGERVEPDNR